MSKTLKCLQDEARDCSRIIQEYQNSGVAIYSPAIRKAVLRLNQIQKIINLKGEQK